MEDERRPDEDQLQELSAGGPGQLVLVFSVTEAAKTLRISRRLIYELLAAGDLKSFKIRSRRLISVTEVERFIAAREEEATA